MTALIYFNAAKKCAAKVLSAALLCAALASGSAYAASSEHFDSIRDTQTTQRHWALARDYEKQMRYELARQHYLLALAACRSEASQAQLRRELEGIDLQIRTMR